MERVRGNVKGQRSTKRQQPAGYCQFLTWAAECGFRKLLLAGGYVGILPTEGRGWPGTVVQLLLCGDKGFLLFAGRKNVFELPGIDQSITYETNLRPMIRALQSVLTAANLIRSTAVFK
ncbi:hypothetical protein ADU59_19085 [Pararhizobium polonicum]|uniref:Uncharacterized protein n=1 Tax=Pararhizobium polonicum TaxID=1612624 RepID=A0A1C7NXR8_9HYPH|nr:hypothetical protein ADU59_19085 [Pararhizobium polonicum]